MPGFAEARQFEDLYGVTTAVVDIQCPCESLPYIRVWIDPDRGIPLRVSHSRQPDQRTCMEDLCDIIPYQLSNGAWIAGRGGRIVDTGDHASYAYLTVDMRSATTDLPWAPGDLVFPPGAVITSDLSGATIIQGQTCMSYGQVRQSGVPFVEGRVWDLSGRPVVDAVVDCRRSWLTEDRTQPLPVEPQSRCVLTDAEGRFALPAEGAGFRDLHIYPRDLANSLVFSVWPGDRGIQAVLDQGVDVFGRVIISEGRGKVPLRDRLVVASLVEPRQGGWIPSKWVRTDWEGQYVIRNLATRLPRRLVSPGEGPTEVCIWEISCGWPPGLVSETLSFNEGQKFQKVDLVIGSSTEADRRRERAEAARN
jgi:hypothetical protein